MANILVRELGDSVPLLLEPLLEHVDLALGSVAVEVLAIRDLKRFLHVQQVQPFHQPAANQLKSVDFRYMIRKKMG